jgi:large subunit ribosomal protein L4
MKKVSKKVQDKKTIKKEKTFVAPLYNQKGEELGQINLRKEMFGSKVNKNLLAQAVRVYLTNQRQGSASSKTRSEVSGGGAKPWRQKGLGRARAGSSRIPHWRGGGVVHGPKPKKFALTLPKKMRKQAMLCALSAKAHEGDIVVLDDLKFKEPKTKLAADLMSKLPVKGKGLLTVKGKDEAVQKSMRNLPNIKLESVHNLNTYSILNTDKLIFTKDTLKEMEQKFLERKENGDK